MGTNDLSIARGDDKTVRVALTNASGTAIDITGYEFFFTAKTEKVNSLNDSGAAISIDVTSPTDPTNGITDIEIPSATTGSLSIQNYFYDIQMKDTSNEITTVVNALLKVSADVTRRTS